MKNEVEVVLDKNLKDFPDTIQCPTCGSATYKMEYFCHVCKTQIILVEGK